MRSSPRRRLARALIAFVVALAVSIPVIGAGLMDAAIVFALAFGVTFGALLLITNP
jgi:hypothetical protein